MFFKLHGVDRDDKPVWQLKLNRNEWIKLVLGTIEPVSVIRMEVGGSATLTRERDTSQFNNGRQSNGEPMRE
jgi:hypothetical protein